MASTKKDPVLVVLQLTGGNDYLNTVIPYQDPLYRDFRPAIRISDNQILHLDDEIGLHPNMGPIREMYNQGKVQKPAPGCWPSRTHKHPHLDPTWAM